MSSDPINADGFFKCRRCGQCCKGYGGTYLSDGDIQNISAYIQADPVQFVDRYCSWSGDRVVLAQRGDGYCVFWDRLCTIHPVKPHMCRKWPFIESILVDSVNWLILADSCPGIRTDIDFSLLVAVVRQNRW